MKNKISTIDRANLWCGATKKVHSEFSAVYLHLSLNQSVQSLLPLPPVPRLSHHCLHLGYQLDAEVRVRT